MVKRIITVSYKVLSFSKYTPLYTWLERIRVYRERLASRTWKLNVAAQQYAIAVNDKAMDEGRQVEGSFNYPMTILFGMDDIAIDPRLVLDGIEQYLPYSSDDDAPTAKQSHVIKIPGYLTGTGLLPTRAERRSWRRCYCIYCLTQWKPGPKACRMCSMRMSGRPRLKSLHTHSSLKIPHSESETVYF